MSSNLMVLLNFKHLNNFLSGDKLILWMQALQKKGSPLVVLTALGIFIL